ncbi:MAG: universal stress protein [Desulfobacteraceae bacterium]|nr:MAG: universal stress protein [Desulfobacteraceae bacterium]
MIAKILVAYDGSCQAQKAFDFALDMALKYSAEMTVISVARPTEPPVNVEIQAVLEHATEYFKSHFEQMKTRASAAGIPAVFEVRVGHPAEQIVHLAGEIKADAIVMGHRGESLFQKWLLGSVARKVLSHAHCTVIVVRC